MKGQDLDESTRSKIIMTSFRYLLTTAHMYSLNRQTCLLSSVIVKLALPQSSLIEAGKIENFILVSRYS